MKKLIKLASVALVVSMLSFTNALIAADSKKPIVIPLHN